jgi:hypothetical protein
MINKRSIPFITYQKMDFTQPKCNFFAQAQLAFDVSDLISIVIVSSTLDATQ